MRLTDTGGSLSGSADYEGYATGVGCPSVNLHAEIRGTVTANTARISSSYDHGAGSANGTLALNGSTLTLTEEGGDGATFTRG